MILLTSIELEYSNLCNRFYPSFNKLVLVFNILISYQKYIIIDKRTKTCKKSILEKVLLIFNNNKKYINNINKKTKYL